MLKRYAKAKKLIDLDNMVTEVPLSVRWTGSETFEYQNLTAKGSCKKQVTCSFNVKTKEKTISAKKDEIFKNSVSPDGKYEIVEENYNLFLVDKIKKEKKQLTFDGCEYYSYGTYSGTCELIKQKVTGEKTNAGVLWSCDSRKFVTYLLDERNVKPLHVVQNVTGDKEDSRPKLHTFKYALPNDEQVPQAQLIIFHIETGKKIEIDYNPLLVNFTPPVSDYGIKLRWTKDSEKIYFTAMNRYFNCAEFVLADSNNGKCSKIYQEQSQSFLFYDSYGESDGNERYNFTNYVFSDCCHAVWQSARDGFNQLFLINCKDGKSIDAITSEEIDVVSITAVDEKKRIIYFMARNLPNCSEPYYQCLCSINCDGSDFKVLTLEDGFHKVWLSPNLNYFVDIYSRVDLPPITKVKEIGTKEEILLENADVSELIENGYIFPKRFSILSEDKIPIYGIIIFPPFSQDKQPLIDYIYGGVQSCAVPKEFTWRKIDGKEVFGGLQALAQLGFIGIILDGRGTPKRGQTFHNACYKNLQGGAGISDHVWILKQLAAKYPQIDIEKVGIWGSSGGGYAALRAMCSYPDIYKVGISVAGNHIERNYCYSWVERYNGEYNEDVYDKQDNSLIVDRLKGKLMLVHGDLDDNVNISNTMTVVDKLIKNNKDFDLIIVPNAFHNVAATPYIIRKRWDYFVTNLLGEKPPKEFML